MKDRESSQKREITNPRLKSRVIHSTEFCPHFVSFIGIYVRGILSTNLRYLCAFPTSCLSDNYDCLIVLHKIENIVSVLKRERG